MATPPAQPRKRAFDDSELPSKSVESSHKKEEVLPTLRTRLAFIYPLYACGLVLDLLTLYWRDIRLPEWWAVLSQAFLCQSFVPWLPEAGVQAQCWFLSALVPYWLSFDFVFRR